MEYLAALEQTGLSVWIRETPTVWAFPFILFLHTLGLGMVAGLSVAINIWVLTFAGRHPVAPMRAFFPAVWFGFVVSLVSGILLLIAYPAKALTDPVFYVKIALIVIALLNLRWIRQRVVIAADAGQPLPVDSKLRAVAGVSIALWAGAVLAGRLLAYTYNYLMATDMLMGY